jgi:hypothetical protein
VGQFAEEFPQELKLKFILERLRHATHRLGGCPGRALMQGRGVGFVVSHVPSAAAEGHGAPIFVGVWGWDTGEVGFVLSHPSPEKAKDGAPGVRDLILLDVTCLLFRRARP